MLFKPSVSIIRVIKSRRMTCAGQVTRMRKRKGAHNVYVRKFEGKRPLVGPRRRQYNIKIGLI